jgi:glucosyl-dolichyl phosphate glucuronosyltransferase
MKPAISVIVPAYKRVEQTIKTLDLLLASRGYGTEYDAEVIVSDCSPDTALMTALSSRFGDKVIGIHNAVRGIATNKNAGAKKARHPILVFCDSDIEVEPDTLIRTVKAFTNHPKAAGITGTVIWKGGPKDGAVDRPETGDRLLVVGTTTYIEMIYSRYFATYASVFTMIGGYDEVAFNFRGEGSDLSMRYWRAGYPLAYDPTIIVHHVAEVEESMATRVATPQYDIAKDWVLLSHRFGTNPDLTGNFSKTVNTYFSQFPSGLDEMTTGVAHHLEFISKVIPHLTKERSSESPKYPFTFLDVFSDESVVKRLIENVKIPG